MLTKKEVMSRFCALAYRVMVDKYHAHIPADCFCGDKPEDFTGYQFDESVMEFIETAVTDKLQR